MFADDPMRVFAAETNQEQKTVRVGYVNVATYEEGSYQEGLLNDWLLSNDIQAETIKYDGYETMMAALDEGKIDAIATPDLATSYDYMPIVNIGFCDYYFAVSKSRPDLLKELNAALYEIQNSELDYNNLLVSRYHNKMSNSQLLSEKEKEWLANHDNQLRIGYLADNLPYSRQSEDGEMLGVMKALADTLKKEFEISIESKCYETSMQLNEALEKGKVDTIGPIYSDFYLAEQKNYVLTNAFLSTTPVILFQDHNVDTYSNVIAVTNESLFPEEVVQVLFPESEIYLCDGIEECLDAVVSGKADSTLVTSFRLNVLRQYPAMDELQFADTQLQSEICLATTKANRVAASILNKGISLSSDTLNGVALAENSYVKKNVTIRDFVKDHMTVVCVSAGFIILVLGLMLYRVYVNGKKLSVALDEAKNANVLADPVGLREVLVNILSNAVKFTNDGGNITFTTDYLKKDNDNKILVHYTITDTGIGMSKEYVGNIFEEFSQEDSGARTHYTGTGLGMPITKRYVELMGGTISVESEKGVGTTVEVELPMEMVSPEEVQEQNVPLVKTDLTGVKVLLVEDNELNAEIAQVQLEEYGMQVTNAVNGKEAVEAFEGNPPGTFDLILMDIMMPIMDGYEATKVIRSMKDREDAYTIPIIAMTANAFAEDVQTSMDAILVRNRRYYSRKQTVYYKAIRSYNKSIICRQVLVVNQERKEYGK